MVDSASPIAYGYGDTLSVYCFNGPIFNISNVVGGGGGGGAAGLVNERQDGALLMILMSCKAARPQRCPNNLLHRKFGKRPRS
jgi:hypothetical protein